MAIYVHCPTCNTRLDTMAPTCPSCNHLLPAGVLSALGMALGQTVPPPMAPQMHMPPHLVQPTPAPQTLPPLPSPSQHSALRPWLAAALSMCCGLGQLYNGQRAKGLILMALGAVAVLTIQMWVGKVLAPIVWLYAILDAYLVGRRSVDQTLSRQPSNGR